MMQFGDQFTDEEVDELIAEVDINKDGKIDYEEFSKTIMKEISWKMSKIEKMFIKNRYTCHTTN